MKTVLRYSEAFKRQVVDELERGKHTSIYSANRVYGIRGADTITRWIKKYGRDDIQPRITRVETMNERNELKEARKQIRELKAALADVNLDYCLEKTYLEICCERTGVSVNDFKKKNATTLSAARTPRTKKRSI